MNKIKNIKVLVLLLSAFLVYNLIVYTQKSASSAPIMSSKALEGEKIWQENNCTACHQLYGLGGYLGPDLTNVISHPQKGDTYVKAFLNSGVNSMPKFDFSEIEKDKLVEFLSHVDQTGFYPNKEAVFNADGWVSIKYK